MNVTHAIKILKTGVQLVIVQDKDELIYFAKIIANIDVTFDLATLKEAFDFCTRKQTYLALLFNEGKVEWDTLFYYNQHVEYCGLYHYKLSQLLELETVDQNTISSIQDKDVKMPLFTKKCFLGNFDQIWELLVQYPKEMFIIYPALDGRYILQSDMLSKKETNCIFFFNTLSFVTFNSIEALPEGKMPQGFLIERTKAGVAYTVIQSPRQAGIPMLVSPEDWIMGASLGKTLIHQYLELR